MLISQSYTLFAAILLVSASFFTSEATTEKPLPFLPAWQLHSSIEC
jgi:hypothetical protein